MDKEKMKSVIGDIIGFLVVGLILALIKTFIF